MQVVAGIELHRKHFGRSRHQLAAPANHGEAAVPLLAIVALVMRW